MKSTSFATIALAITVLVGLGTSVPIGARGQDDGRARQYAGSFDARQHGYEHAYRDGADRGRQDRERRSGYTLKDNDYLIGCARLRTAFGDKTLYMQGYRDGYKTGYDDGYNGRAGQYGQLYARPQAGSRAPCKTIAYADRPYSSTDMAFDAGYRDGVTLGQQDHSTTRSLEFSEQLDTYRNGDLGYRSSYGDRDAVPDPVSRRLRAWLRGWLRALVNGSDW